MAISAGGQHSCALLADGTLRCWGIYLGLGTGTTTTSRVPVAVSGLANAVDVSAGSNWSCAILTGGAARCWGDNLHGQLGNGIFGSSLLPVPVVGFP